MYILKVFFFILFALLRNKYLQIDSPSLVFYYIVFFSQQTIWSVSLLYMTKKILQPQINLSDVFSLGMASPLIQHLALYDMVLSLLVFPTSTSS